MDKLKDTIGYLKDEGWMGESGAALMMGALCGIALELHGMEGAVWGAPLSLVYAATAAAGAFLLTASLRLIPDR